MNDDQLDGPEWHGRINRLESNAQERGESFDRSWYENPDGPFAQEYLELAHVLNDRELWASDEYRAIVWRWLQDWDFIDYDVDEFGWGDTGPTEKK